MGRTEIRPPAPLQPTRGPIGGPGQPAAPKRGGTCPLARRLAPAAACPHIWPCSGWGLPSQAVARPLVGSYPTISPLPEPRRAGCAHVGCCHPVGTARPTEAIGGML